MVVTGGASRLRGHIAVSESGSCGAPRDASLALALCVLFV